MKMFKEWKEVKKKKKSKNLGDESKQFCIWQIIQEKNGEEMNRKR